MIVVVPKWWGGHHTTPYIWVNASTQCNVTQRMQDAPENMTRKASVKMLAMRGPFKGLDIKRMSSKIDYQYGSNQQTVSYKNLWEMDSHLMSPIWLRVWCTSRHGTGDEAIWHKEPCQASLQQLLIRICEWSTAFASSSQLQQQGTSSRQLLHPRWWGKI